MKPPVSDLAQFSALVGVKGRGLTYMATHMAQNVNKHQITTNNGAKKRTIYAPSDGLKCIQSRLREAVILAMPTPEHVHGFVPGKSLVTNAREHVDSGLVVNLDLKDFFPSIGVKRVYGFWRWVFDGIEDDKQRKRLSWIATRITTFDEHLCQGFVTSPDIANRVAWKLDLRVSALAKSQGIRYTRYADDLTFSMPAYAGNCKWLIDAVSDIAKDEGFLVNPKKIAIMRKHRRQTVTGLVVNNVYDVETRTLVKAQPRVPRYEIRKLRAMCDKGQALSPADRQQLEGWLAYVHSVTPDKASKLRDILNQRLTQPRTTK